MREILFRGKSKPNGEWVEGFLVDAQHIGNWIESDPVDPETVGQFTVLTDKNGKKIFEGDIVKFTDSPFGYSHAGEVVFHEGAFCIKYKYWASKITYHRIGQTDTWQDMGASGELTYSYEKLGNIHDNPELMRKEK